MSSDIRVGLGVEGLEEGVMDALTMEASTQDFTGIKLLQKTLDSLVRAMFRKGVLRNKKIPHTPEHLYVSELMSGGETGGLDNPNRGKDNCRGIPGTPHREPRFFLSPGGRLWPESPPS